MDALAAPLLAAVAERMERMTRIEFDCDRCGNHVSGIHTLSGTGGFYVVDPEKAWAEYALSREDPERQNPEHFVCDECIQSMPLYKERYQS